MAYLDAVETRFDYDPEADFPFNLALFATREVVRFDTPVTFFVGDNGAGKSTLLEAIAASFGLPALTQVALAQHPLMQPAAALAKKLTLIRRTPKKRGFFFRADDVVGFVQSLRRTADEHRELEAHFDETLTGEGHRRATSMARAQHEAIAARYGDDPFARSHGELFLELFRQRLTAPGLYLMDEPETPLSPINQLALMALIMDKVEDGSQFIVATHSPILMALPGATILDFDQAPPQPIAWDEVDHVAVTKAFLNNPETFLRRL
jgi:predicted ATPase